MPTLDRTRTVAFVVAFVGFVAGEALDSSVARWIGLVGFSVAIGTMVAAAFMLRSGREDS